LTPYSAALALDRDQQNHQSELILIAARCITSASSNLNPVSEP
jgi:hypothetical protein